MSRIRNQQDFVKKAKELYGEKYDYSLVQYEKSSIKVRIVCSEHGVFEKTPNKHLSGQGCPVCGRKRTCVSFDDFVKRARKVHGDKYQYVESSYASFYKKCEIICPVHGLFQQIPHSHVDLHQECPKCGHAKAGKKRMGEHNVAHRQDVKDMKAATCLKRYGAKTWAESNDGRQRLHDIIVHDGKLDKMKATCQERYGTDFWVQSDEGRKVLHELMSSEEMRSKIVEGYRQEYGMHYMQTEQGRECAKTYIDDERREKMKDALIRRYGVPYVVFTEEERFENLKKSWRTKRENGTWNTSKPEKTLYGLLCDKYGERDVLQQYVDDERYPFHCDFYIKSQDLFIELNAHWSHGKHWFDASNVNDLKLLEKWKVRAKERGSRYYYAAIDVWTVRDLLKRQFAIDNELNYIVFWKQDLSDAREYLSSL